MAQALNADRMRAALARLDELSPGPAHLVIGGGAAMVLAYDHPLATEDVDAFAVKGSLRVADLEEAARKVAKELDAEPTWLNAHFDTFAGVLPPDYGERLRQVYQGQQLRVDALGPEDLLIMKSFAGRDKDLPHARKLVRVAADLELVDRHLSTLVSKRYPGAERAADFFDDLRDEAGL